jgi:hypothetical protein
MLTKYTERSSLHDMETAASDLVPRVTSLPLATLATLSDTATISRKKRQNELCGASGVLSRRDP